MIIVYYHDSRGLGAKFKKKTIILHYDYFRLKKYSIVYYRVKSADVIMCLKDEMIAAACVSVCTYNSLRRS